MLMSGCDRVDCCVGGSGTSTFLTWKRIADVVTKLTRNCTSKEPVRWKCVVQRVLGTPQKRRFVSPVVLQTLPEARTISVF